MSLAIVKMVIRHGQDCHSLGIVKIIVKIAVRDCQNFEGYCHDYLQIQSKSLGIVRIAKIVVRDCKKCHKGMSKLLSEFAKILIKYCQNCN